MPSDGIQRWLVRYVHTSEALGRALDLSVDGRDQRVVVLDRLAVALRISADSLGDAGYSVLDALVPPLEDALQDHRSNWVADAQTGRHRAIAEEATKELPLESILEACAQFGWQHQRLDVRQPQIAEIDSAIRAFFNTKLAQRVFSALEQWRTENVRPAARPR